MDLVSDEETFKGLSMREIKNQYNNWIDVVQEGKIYSLDESKSIANMGFFEPNAEAKFSTWFSNESSFSNGICANLVSEKPLYETNPDMMGLRTAHLTLHPNSTFISQKHNKYIPKTIDMWNARRYSFRGNLHDFNSSTPAIQIKKLRVEWHQFKYCKHNQIDYRPGPFKIVFKNYREYWTHGKFISRTWDSVNMYWIESKSLMNQYCSSSGLPRENEKWNIQTNSKRERELANILNTLSKPVELFQDRFFTSDTDEFRFLDFVQSER